LASRRAEVNYLTVLTPCYNEEENVRELHARVDAVMASVPDCEYEHLFIDNASTDKTVEILRQMAAEDERVKVIVNTRNFGHIRSPYHGILQAGGDAVILCVADLQDPPDLLPRFIAEWRAGHKVVVGVKESSGESWLMFRMRKAYYRLVGGLSSDVQLVRNFTGFGLYDREVVEQLRRTNEQYPYFRGLVCDLGYERSEISYQQPARARGRTKNGFFSLYDLAMLGITSHSKVPLRIAGMAGFALSILSLIIAFGYLVAKLVFWNKIQVGIAPVIIGIYFFGSVQLFFIGMLGEYIGSIHVQVHRRPVVVERERINLDGRPELPDFVLTGSIPRASE
jgi:glycosyltransferase involved in cell wall biosynthesis